MKGSWPLRRREFRRRMWLGLQTQLALIGRVGQSNVAALRQICGDNYAPTTASKTTTHGPRYGGHTNFVTGGVSISPAAGFPALQCISMRSSSDGAAARSSAGPGCFRPSGDAYLACSTARSRAPSAPSHAPTAPERRCLRHSSALPPGNVGLGGAAPFPV